MKVLLLYPTGNYLGNLYWPTPFIGSTENLNKGIEYLREQNFWVSRFPEGDGLVFKHENFESNMCLCSFKKAFPWMDIEVIEQNLLSSKLAEINKNKVVKTKVLVPVEKLKIHDQLDFRKFKLIPGISVEADYEEIENHPWVNLLFEPSILEGESNDTGRISSYSSLMRYTLLEMNLKLPYELLIKSEASLEDQNRLIRKVIQEADTVLDLIRLNYCCFSRMEYLIGMAGQMNDGFSSVLLIPEGMESKLLSGIVYPAMVQNNWLGLELDSLILDDFTEKIIDILDGTKSEEIDKVVLGAIKRFGQSFYIIQNEARFLSLVYAIDAVTLVKSTGQEHREHICSIAANAEKTKFDTIIQKYKKYYKVRNKIVHEGKTFEDLGYDPIVATNTMGNILYSCIETIVNLEVKTKRELQNWVTNNKLKM